MNALYRTGAGARQVAYTTLNPDPNQASDNHYYGLKAMGCLNY
jgi:hypothetical protein